MIAVVFENDLVNEDEDVLRKEVEERKMERENIYESERALSS